MFQNLHPKCANPACVKTFDWLGGGRLFRFHRNPEQLLGGDETTDHLTNSHHVEHFWLCERCSHIFTLTYEPARGVLIRQLWPQLSAGEKRLELPVS
jgi:hypothetical protein